MAIEVIATPNAANANSFITLAEYAYYHERRLPLDPPVITTGDVAARNVIMATRVLSAMAVARKSLRWDRNGKPFYYTSKSWTGTIATDTQALAWGRIGMYDRLGRLIPSDSIPQELKDATAELAGQLGNSDTTLDNDIQVQGITSIKAGSVALTFKDMIESHVLPDFVIQLMPDSWFTSEKITYATQSFLFEAV
jgi:hypothetical protein